MSAAAASASASASASAIDRAPSRGPSPCLRISKDLTICNETTKLVAGGSLKMLDLFFHSMHSSPVEINFPIVSKPSWDPTTQKRVAKLYAQAIGSVLPTVLAELIGTYCPEIGSVDLPANSLMAQAISSAGLETDSRMIGGSLTIVARNILIVAPKEHQVVSMRVQKGHSCFVIAVPHDPSGSENQRRTLDTDPSFFDKLPIQNLEQGHWLIVDFLVVPITDQGRDMRYAELFRTVVHGVDLRDASKLTQHVLDNQPFYEAMLDRSFARVSFPSAPIPANEGGGGGAASATSLSRVSTRASGGGDSIAAAVAPSLRGMFAGRTFVSVRRTIPFAGRASPAASVAAAGGEGGGAAEAGVVKSPRAKRAKLTLDSSPAVKSARRTPSPMEVDADASTQPSSPLPESENGS